MTALASDIIMMTPAQVASWHSLSARHTGRTRPADLVSRARYRLGVVYDMVTSLVLSKKSPADGIIMIPCAPGSTYDACSATTRRVRSRLCREHCTTAVALEAALPVLSLGGLHPTETQ